MLKDRKAYETRLDAQLAAWGAGLARLKAKAKVASVDGMMKVDGTLDTLKEKHSEASAHLHRLKTTGDETWEHVKTGTEKAWVEIKALFERTAH